MFTICALSSSQTTSSSFDLSPYIISNLDGQYNYLFEDTIDLKGATISFPSKSVITFNRGVLRNGIIVGDSTIINCNKETIFDNIEILGSWKISELSTRLFAETDSCILKYLSTLSSDKQYNVIYIDDECRTPIKPWSSYFIIKSNTDLILNADIYTLPADCDGGYCINIVGENVNIQGNNHFLFGTIPDPRQVKCSEWLHGLNIDARSKNVVVKNLNSWLFCGDGFYNAGSNITLDSIHAKFNGRQGLSITNGENIIVKNSSFTNTAYYRLCSGNGPGAGIDIEPNDKDKVNNIGLVGCTVINNHRYLKDKVNDIEIYKAYDGYIEIRNCDFSGLYIGSCDNLSIKNSFPKSIYFIDQEVSMPDFINILENSK